MAKLEEIDSDDEEVAKPKNKEPDMDFNTMLKKAAELKTAQLKDKRREWEAAPEWLKNTMMYERQGDVKEIRETKTLSEKLEAATKFKDDGNAHYAAGKLDDAMTEYVKCVAVYRLFRRIDKQEMIWLDREEEKLEPEERQKVEDVLGVAFTNIAQCMIKMRKPYDAVYASNQALELNPKNVKALYRRALARVAEDTSTTLEMAVKDLDAAHKLAPDDMTIKLSFRKHRGELLEQREKDEQTFGRMFDRGELYTEEEQKEMQKGDKVNHDKAAQDIPEYELKQRAKQAGIDLDDPATRRVLEAKAKKQQEDELKMKAKEYGINLDDPEIRKLMEAFEKEKELEELKKKVGDIPAWRRYLVRALDPKRRFNFQRFCYFLICLHVVYRVYNMYKQMPKNDRYVDADDSEYGNSVWSSAGSEF
mmetsp:Transcript_30954/g.42901  ORF Transcript_30954/g.42901 Transcript_30954/m.42901 type:complete len:420 (-) Transcript_30954:313-1572(-)